MAAPRAGLTDQQQRAIAARDTSVALSAGAGCGKTFVLTERFLAFLEPAAADADPRQRLDELVAITFTERAAREMRWRIRAACRRRLIEAPAEQADYWLGLIRELDSARISTIHSFCGTLLRTYAVEGELDPHFQVLDQAQADVLLSTILDDELRSRLARQDAAVIDLVVRVGLEPLRSMVAELLGRRQEIDWESWRGVTPDELTARWAKLCREVTLPRVVAALARSPEAKALLEIAREHRPGNATMQGRCDAIVECFARIEQGIPGDEALPLLESLQSNARVQGGGSKATWPSEEIYERFSKAAESVRKQVKAACGVAAFSEEAARPAAEIGLAVLWLTESADAAYRAQKQQVGALDFDDLLIHTRDLLAGPHGPSVRRRLASQTGLLLVDEFQDTDSLQVEVVKSLCGEGLARGKLFFVGDYKQSIYRFRGADPHVFRQLRQEMPREGRLPLSLNFRSQPAILDFVNAMFCGDLGPEYEPLSAHRPQVSPEPAVEFLWAPDPEPEDRSGQIPRQRRQEADWIARRLRAIFDSREPIVWDAAAACEGHPAARPATPGDVAILFRALSDVQFYEEALRRHGIDYYLVGGHAFYAQQEVFDLLNLLRTLASRCDLVSLAGVLRSPMFNLEDETLFWLCQHPEGLAVALDAAKPPRELSAEQRRCVRFASGVLAELRAAKDRLPVAELIRLAMDRTAYDAVLVAEFLGERKLANLRKLIDQARTMDHSGLFTLADFITQLSEFVARQPKEPLAATQPESTDVVRLMTVHQSKGLEFPVVVVPDLDRRAMGSTDPIAFSRPWGPLVRTPDGVGGYELFALGEREEEKAELVRLMYVATTRAADCLILSAGVMEVGSTRGPWSELVCRRFDPENGQLRVTLPGGYREPKIRATAVAPPLVSDPAVSRRPALDKLIQRALKVAKRGEGILPSHLGPVPPDARARRQYSFSRLSGGLQHPQPEPGAAELEEEARSPTVIDPIGLGTLVHAVLAEIDFGRPDDADPWVRRLSARHLPDGGPGIDEAIDLVRRFLLTPRAGKMAAAKACYRELEFLLTWPPTAAVASPESPVFQGFLDCLYQDDSGWHVVDYKTNRVTPATLDAVTEHYRMQMLLYGLAVERLLGQPPAELVLTFLRAGHECRFAWNAEAKEKLSELVNGHLAQQLKEQPDED